MTKHLRFLFVMLLAMIWSAGWAQTTIDFTKVTWNGGYTQAPFSFKGDIGGNTNIGPTQNFNTKDIRLYAKNKLTVSTTGKKIVKIVFTISTAGKKQWAELTATTGSVVADKANSIATWENVEGATSVTFTVGDKCKYGTAAQTKPGQFFFNSVDIYELSAEPGKTPTKVAFPAEYSNKTFTFTEGKLEGFTAPKATETNNVAGTITYSSNNESAVKVNASTGALSFPGYGEATITATFTPTDTETYAVSTDSYKVINNQKVDESVIVFSAEAKSFESIVNGNGYDGNKGKIDFIATNGKKYTFDVQRALKNNGKLQLNKSTVTSPAFPDFTNGYNVTIEYNSTNESATIDLSSGAISVKGKYNDKTILLDVQDGSPFKIVVNAKPLYISKIEIVPNNVILDETATNNTIEAKTGVNVTLKRTMAKGVWNTICLPFGLDKKQATTAFGEGVKVAQLDDTNSTGATLKFVDMTDTGIEASVPYLIKPTIDALADGYKFVGVEIKEAAVIPTKVETAGKLFFNGVYNMVDATTEVTSGYNAAFLGANNTVFGAKPGTNMKGFRAYFAIPNSVKASELRVVIDGTATSIKNIDSEVVESNAPVYNLQGQRVDSNNLTPGIYVKAGKKFVVK